MNSKDNSLLFVIYSFPDFGEIVVLQWCFKVSKGQLIQITKNKTNKEKIPLASSYFMVISLSTQYYRLDVLPWGLVSTQIGLEISTRKIQ